MIFVQTDLLRVLRYMMKKRILATIIIMTALILAGCSGGDDKPDIKAVTPTAMPDITGDVSDQTGNNNRNDIGQNSDKDRKPSGDEHGSASGNVTENGHGDDGKLSGDGSNSGTDDGNGSKGTGENGKSTDDGVSDNKSDNGSGAGQNDNNGQSDSDGSNGDNGQGNGDGSNDDNGQNDDSGRNGDDGKSGKTDDDQNMGNSTEDDNGDADAEKLSEEDRLIVEGYWADSFLAWLPIFEYGKYEDFFSDETHDSIVFTNISINSAKDYIGKLRESGFEADPGFVDDDGIAVEDEPEGSFTYKVSNEDDWKVALRYDHDSSTFTISSGYEEEPEEDVYARLLVETPIGLLPAFDMGSVNSTTVEGDMYYAVFTGVDESCSKYVKKLKKAGFVIDPDEGDSDGIIWYNAENEDGFACEFIYTDGFARIGCGTR